MLPMVSHAWSAIPPIYLEQVQVYVAGTVGAGDRNFMRYMDYDYIAKEPETVELDPWKIRIHEDYFKDVHNERVPLCDPMKHKDYYPSQLEHYDAISGSDLAKIAGGYHCSSKDVIRLYNFMNENDYFEQ